MRLELTAPLTLELGEGEPRRIVAGLAVPWDQTARLRNGRLARFRPGSIDPAPERAPLLCRNHDREHPIGVIVDAADNGTGIYARARISAFAAGDEALTLAGDGVLRGLSVGVEALDWVEEGDPDDPVIVVSAGRWDELSLVPWAAFDVAAVDYVAASAPEPDEPEPEPDPDQPEEPEEPDVPDVLDAAAPAPAPGAPRRGALTPTNGSSLTLLGVGQRLAAAAAAGGGPSMQAIAPIVRELNAALTSVTTPSGVSGVAGLIRPQWIDELIGLIPIGAPVVSAFRQGNLTSNPVTYPKWTTLPTVGVQATEKTAITSTSVRIDPATAAVSTIAGGNDVSVQALDWSSPSFLAEYLAACAEVYARKIDDIFVTAVLAAATGVAAGATLGASLAAGIAQVATTGLVPNLIIVSADTYGDIWNANVGTAGGAMAAVLNIDLYRPRVVLSPLVAANTMIIASSQAAISWQNQGAPVTLRAVDVSLLGVDLGVYGYFASAILYPTAIVKITGLTTLVGASLTWPESGSEETETLEASAPKAKR